MKTVIEFEHSYGMLTLSLDPDETVKVERRAMVAMEGVGMRTGIGGSGFWGRIRGLARGVKRVVLRESFFINRFTGIGMVGWVSLAPGLPGDISYFDLTPGRDLFIQSGSFLACTDNVELDLDFQGVRGFFTGESLFFIRAYCEQGLGRVFFNSYGGIRKLPVRIDSRVTVDTAHLVAFDDQVRYTVNKVGGIGSLLFSGEGLVMRFEGEGHVWIQSRNLSSLAEHLWPYLSQPKR